MRPHGSRMPRSQQASPSRSRLFLPWRQPRHLLPWRFPPLWQLRCPHPHRVSVWHLSTVDPRAVRTPRLLQSRPVAHVWQCGKPRTIFQRGRRLCAKLGRGMNQHGHRHRRPELGHLQNLQRHVPVVCPRPISSDRALRYLLPARQSQPALPRGPRGGRSK